MNRIVFNADKAYVRQLDKKKSYHLLQPVYTLAILNENYDHQTDKFYHHYAIINKANTNEVIEDLEFVLIELPKFQSEKWGERKMASLWLRFLKDVGENMTVLPTELAANERIRRAAELCEEGAFTPEELAVYEGYWDWVRVEKTIREGSQARGEAIGRAEGETIGIAKGIAQGKAEGKAERDQLETELKAAQKRIAELERLTALHKNG